MYNLFSILRYIKKIAFTCKFFTRLIAVGVIIFLGLATFVITYKTGIDIALFFNLEKQYLININIIKNTTIAISTFVCLATVIQSAPIIWVRLSYWGQQIDNKIIRIFTGKKYFIYLANKKISKARKLINQGNSEFQMYIWEYVKNNEIKYGNQLIQQLNQLLEVKIAPAIDIYRHVVYLLKNNETDDTESNNKKYQCDLELNGLIEQISQIIMNIVILKHVILNT